MNLERLPQLVTVVAINVLGLIAAIWCGSVAGHGDTKTVLVFFGASLTLLLVFKARTKIWLLIPITGSIGYQLAFVPGGLPLKYLSIALVFGSFCTFKALKILRVRPIYCLLDFLMLINLLYLLSVFIRNPVGTEAMGFNKIGGKAYIDVAFSLMAYWIFQHIRISPSTAGKLPYLMSMSEFANGLLDAIVAHFPQAGIVLGYFFKGMDASNIESYEKSQVEDDSGLAREQYLAFIGGGLYKLLCSVVSPRTLINPIYIGRFILFFFSIYLGLISGHRSTLPFFAVMFGLSLYFRGRGGDILKMAFFLAPTLAVALFLQGNFVQFPLTIQRSLCMLPGKWDPAAVESARTSSEWRFEMWRRVMASDKYISNKWLGDGFGFTRAQFMEMLDNPEDNQENFMISGDYHSGPLSTVRNVGYVGLVLFYIMLVYIVIYAWKLVNFAKKTPYFTCAIFVCVPVIYAPFAFTFLAGGHKGFLPDMIGAIGFLRLMTESIKDYKARLALESVEVKVPVATGVPVGHGVGQPA